MESPLENRIETLLRRVQILNHASGQSTPELQEVLGGCRRVFIPQENVEEASLHDQESLQIIPVEDPVDVLRKLQAPLQPLAGDSLQVRKINALKAFCQAKGWDVSSSQPIQDGVQFRLAPLTLPQLVVTINNTGAHGPQKHDCLQ